MERYLEPEKDHNSAQKMDDHLGHSMVPRRGWSLVQQKVHARAEPNVPEKAYCSVGH
jgi:hypothetical protein